MEETMTTETTTAPVIPVFRLRTQSIRAFLARRHRTHRWAARHLGLSRSYWSQLVNGHRPLSPMVRQLLLSSDFFAALPEDELWEQVGPDGGEGAIH